jgi:maltose alpha-D-glucosyltransferase/alpha-amylase
MALRKADRTPIVEILSQTPEIPTTCQWCTFLRNHDELTLEMVSPQNRQWMWEQYAPEARMRLNLGIRRRLAPLLDNDLRKIKLLNSILFTLPGSPVIYYGDEIGMGDNIWLHDRNGVRTPMQWENSSNAGFSSAPVEKLYLPIIDTPEYSPTKVNAKEQTVDPHSLFNATKRMIAIRKNHSAFGWGDFQWAELMDDTPALMAYWRRYKDETILVINNLSEQHLFARLVLPENVPTTAKDLLSNQQVLPQCLEFFDLEMPPYGFMWIKFLSG